MKLSISSLSNRLAIPFCALTVSFSVVVKFLPSLPALSFLFSHSGYQSAASPVGYRATPSPISYSPMTPGAPYTPATPGAAMEQGAGDWVVSSNHVLDVMENTLLKC